MEALHRRKTGQSVINYNFSFVCPRANVATGICGLHLNFEEFTLAERNSACLSAQSKLILQEEREKAGRGEQAHRRGLR